MYVRMSAAGNSESAPALMVVCDMTPAEQVP